MKFCATRLLATGFALLGFAPLLRAQDVWNNGGADQSWSDSANWSAGVPTSSSAVQIGTQPTGNEIGVDTGNISNSIASLTYNNTLTGSTSIVVGTGVEQLQVNGAITNSTTYNQTLSIPVFSGASATYAGGTGGTAALTIGSLNLGTNTIATTGTINVSSLGSTITNSTTYGSIGPINLANGTLTIDTTNYTGTLGNTFQIVTAAGSTLTGATVNTSNVPLSTGLVWNTSNFDTTGAISVTAPASQSLTGPTPSIINIITGATTTVSATLNNTAQAGANNLAVNLADNSSTGGAISGLAAAGNVTSVAANSSVGVSGTLTAGAVGTGKTWSISNTDPNATALANNTVVTTGGTVNVYNQATGVLTVTSPTTIKAITGQTINSTLTFTNSGANNDNLTGQTAGSSGGINASTATLSANQSATSVTGSFVVGAAGNTTTNTYSQAYKEDQTVIGANTNVQNATAGVSVTAYNHANGVLTVTSPTTVNAITGTTVNSTLTFQNSGANNDNLTIVTPGTGVTNLSGTFTGNQEATTVNGATVAGTAGTQTQATYSTTWLEDQTVVGATAGNQTATSGTVTINDYSHANGVLTVTSPTSVKAIAGSTVNSTLTFQNSGATNDNLTIVTPGTGLTNLSGTFTGNQETTTVNGATTAGAAGGTTTATYSTTWLEDQSVLGATAGNQTATANSVTITDYSHANGVLTVTSPTTVKAITGTAVTSDLTFQNSGATNDNLSIVTPGTGVSNLSGTFTGNQETASVTGTTTAGAAGGTTSATYSTTWLEDQSVIGATAGNQTATATTVTIENYDHANGVLTVTSPTTVNAITGTTVNSTLTFQNSGADNDNLAIVSNGTGVTNLSGTFTGNQEATTVNGATVAGTAGTQTQATYSTTWLEDQTVVGATAGDQTATSGTVTINNFSHANGVLTVTSPTSVKAIAGSTVNSTLTFQNSGATNDSLTIVTPGTGLTNLSGTFTANQETATVNGATTAGAAGGTTTANYSTTWLEDQSVLGATAGNQIATANAVTITDYSHANGVLTVTSPTTVKAITGTAVTSDLTFQNSGSTNDNLTIVTPGTGVSNLSGTFTGNQETTTATGTTTAGAAGGTTSATYSTTWLEDQSVIGATAGDQTATATTVTIDNYDHANGVLTVTSPTTVNAIAGTTVNSTLTFQNSGADNDNLTIVTPGTGVTGLSGTFTGNQETTTVNGATVAGTAGGTTTATYSTTWLEDQTVVGATAGNQTATANSVTINDFSHADGVLAVTTPTTITAIAGTTIDSDLTFTNSGATNDNLAAGTAGGGLNAATGTLTANDSQDLTGSFTAGTAGTTATHDYTQAWTEDQTVLGATAGTQTATAGVTVTAVGHSDPGLTVTTDALGNIHQNAVIPNATTTLSNASGPLAALQIVSLGGLTDSGSGLIVEGTGRNVSTTVRSANLGAINSSYTIQTEDDQTVLGATTNGNLTFTVTGNVYSGQSVWSTNGSGSWGTLLGTGGSTFGTNWGTNQGSPGLDSNFADTDTATFDNSTLTGGTQATVSLNGASPSLKSITFNTTAATAGYTVTQGSGGTITLNNGSNTASLNDISGNQLINAPMMLASNASASVTNAGDTLTLSGGIGGSGKSFTVSGAGTVSLGGTNSYSGGTTLTSGKLSLTSLNTLPDDALAVNGGTLNLNTFSQTIGNLSGTGGTITSTGATLTVNETTDPTYAGIITGATAVVYNSSNTMGNLLLTGASTYSGGTTINSGIVAAGSASALGTGNVTVTGGTLTTGNDDTTLVGNTNTERTINVGGTYTQNGGTLELAVGPTSPQNPVPGIDNDVLDVTGIATITAGTLKIDIASGYAPGRGQTYTFIEDGVGSSIAFTNAESSLAALHVSTNGTGYTITQNSFVQLLTGVATPNQNAVAQYFDSYDTTVATGNPFYTVVGALNGISNNTAALASALDQLTPEKFGNFVSTSTFNNATFATQELAGYLNGQHSANGEFLAGNGQIDSSGFSVIDPTMDPGLALTRSRLLAWDPAPLGHGLLSDATDPMVAGIDSKEMSTMSQSEPSNPWNVFVIGNAVLAQDFSQADLPHADTTTGAVQVGASFRITPHLRVGAVFGYGHTDADLDNMGSKATSDTYSPGAFVSFADGGWYANALGSYGFDSFTEDREVSIGGFSGDSHGAPSGDQIVADVNGGYDFHVKNLTFGPTLGLQYTHLSVDSFNEGGDAPVDLSVGSQNADSLRSLVGGHIGYVFQTGKVLLKPHFDAGWQHDFMDQSRGITSQFTSVGAGSFSVNTPQPSRDSALIDLGLDADINRSITIFGDYSVQAGQSNYFGQSVQAGMKIGF